MTISTKQQDPRLFPSRTNKRALLLKGCRGWFGQVGLLVLGLSLARPARAELLAPPRWVLEFDTNAEQRVDPSATRRLLSLELEDLTIPLLPGETMAAPLFFRVTAQTPGSLKVELWECKTAQGARILGGMATKSALAARRTALAAAELVRRLQRKRTQSVRRMLREEQRRKEQQLLAVREASERAPALRATGVGSVLGEGALFLIGPRLAGQWALPSKLHLELTGGWLVGHAPQQSLAAEWWELSIGLGRRFQVLDWAKVGVWGHASAAVVQFQGATAVDGIRGERETWAARAAGVLRFEPDMSRMLRLSVGGELGMVLRRIPVQGVQGDPMRLGGIWVGVDIGVLLLFGEYSPSAKM